MPTEQAKPAVVTPSLQQWRAHRPSEAPGKTTLKWLKEEIVQDEVERVLAPVSTKPTETEPRPTYAAVTRKYRAPVQKFPPEPRKTDVWRTADNRPVCFHCGRPGHVMRYCREKGYPRRHIADPVSRQAVGSRKTKESDLQDHDVILGWDFLERLKEAVIDCGQNELVLEDICRDSHSA
ncbi:CCHC-type domain-containing protein [Trichonephila clavipes]|nr:CCHC-type domain-containing protein [Trichonephila clavipes]